MKTEPFRNRYTRPGPGIPKDAPQKRGVPLFFEVFRREGFELVKLNLLFLLCCVPVVTIPPALTAMSRITAAMVRDRNHFLWPDFLETFRAEFRRSLAVGWPLLAATAASGFGVFFYRAAARASPFFYPLMLVSMLLTTLLLILAFYLFPMLALVELPLRPLIKDAALLVFINLPKNLLALAAGGLIWLLYLGLLPWSLPIAFVFLFAPVNFITTFCAWDGISRYVVKEP